jgi:pimeloyl-ACP methyl ester carboxylesterase
MEGVASPLTFERTVKTIVAWAFSPQVAPELRERAERLMGETRSSVLLGDFKACDAFDILSRLKELSVPALILCGEVDRLTPPRYAEYLTEQIPGAQMRLIPQAGHMVMLERPKLVAQYLRDFLRNISFHPGEAIDLKGDEDDRG